MHPTPRPVPEDFFADWKAREELAENMIPLMGKLYRKNNVSCYIYGRSLVNRSVIEIMKAHRFARQLGRSELSEFETWPVVQELARLNLGPSHIDIGRITANFMRDDRGLPIADYVRAEVGPAADAPAKPLQQPRDLVLYGFGRIGRLLARLLVEKAAGGDVLRLRAIVVRRGTAPSDIIKRASLLRRDSVHGSFRGTIRVLEDREQLVINGNVVQLIYATDPATIDYQQHGIDNAILIDNTGAWTDETALAQHLNAKGIDKVLLTAPGKGTLKNIVAGVNSAQITPKDRLITAASCTTNAIVPALKLIHDNFHIRRGHVETVHAYTNDQNLIDNYHKADRRGRSAPLNMVLTSTGAASAVAKALPELKGRLTGHAIRVPTPNVSLAILHLTLETPLTTDQLNDFMRHASLHSDLHRQIDFTDSPEVVSNDLIGSRAACVFDSQSTLCNGDSAVLYLWYDNEFGYSCQVYRVLEKMAGVSYPVYPVDG
ncbi:MAG: glyceraldehyde-3-phosphate dehydrogenase [Cellvibrionales bacterium]|nr:glyceraldehyde-3-phosphate dehydrogenase [Cellvibrionales bacterium]